MSSNFRIFPYAFSEGAKHLNEKLDGLLIKREGSRYIYRPRHIVINWGSSRLPEVLRNARVLNRPSMVQVASSKIQTYRALAQAGVKTLEFTESQAVAADWARNHKVVARDLDHGSQGNGIHVYQRNEQVGQHRFYTKYYTKAREFRFHVLGGNVIFTQEKKKRKGAIEYDKYVRSHSRGWCFAFNHLGENPVPQGLDELATSAVHALELDFGAVDLGWNDRDGGTVIEVNTAPGIEESSLEAYVNAFRSL